LENAWQTNGQLMGSVLSFPYLCAANLICFMRAVTRVCGLRNLPVPSVKDLPVLINGDDILFISD